MTENLLELVMIVKNSGEVLRGCLNSIKPYINTWTILDTGSTDNTPKIIMDELKDIPGDLHFEEFVDFSTSRNRSLDLSKKTCKYQIILDDSYEIHGGDKLIQKLVESNDESFGVKIGILDRQSGFLCDSYYSIRIIKTSKNFRYLGAIHENLKVRKINYIEENIFFVNDIQTREHNIRSKNRLGNDIKLLKKELLEGKTPERTELILYLLGMTLQVLERYSEIQEVYKQLEKITKEREYSFVAKYNTCIIKYMYEHKESKEEFIKKMEKLSKTFPERYGECAFNIISATGQGTEKIIKNLMVCTKPKLYITVLDTKIYDYYIPYTIIDYHIKTRKINTAVPALKNLLEKYPLDQPLLNIKHALCDPAPVSYLGRQKVVVIHMGDFFYAWDPVNNLDISGSEYMAINVGKEFLRRGYRVFLFGMFEDEEKNYECVHDEIQYIDNKKFLEFSSKYYIDILIVSRFMENLAYYDNIEKVYLWVHDVYPIGKTFQTHPKKFKGMIVLGNWHKKTIQSVFNVENDKIILSRNAIDPSRFSPQVDKIPYRFIYISDPSRGLNILVELIQKIKIKYPQTTLKIFARTDDIDTECLNTIKTLDYIELSPRTTQKSIAVEFLKSDVWLYPTTFKETYCISALEAMASNCLVASVKLAGIEDTVGSRGILVDHPITEHKDELLKKLFYVLDNKVVKDYYLNEARTWAMEQNFENLITEWIN